MHIREKVCYDLEVVGHQEVADGGYHVFDATRTGIGAKTAESGTVYANGASLAAALFWH